LSAQECAAALKFIVNNNTGGSGGQWIYGGMATGLELGGGMGGGHHHGHKHEHYQEF